MRVYMETNASQRGMSSDDWGGYYELRFVDYNDAGEVIGEGLENCSSAKIKALRYYYVREKTGEVGKDGKPKYRYLSVIRANERVSAEQIKKVVYPGKDVKITRF